MASDECFYLDSDTKISDNNFGNVQILAVSKDGNEVTCIIPLNRYSFFKSLETNMLPQVKSKLVLI